MYGNATFSLCIELNMLQSLNVIQPSLWWLLWLLNWLCAGQHAISACVSVKISPFQRGCSAKRHQLPVSKINATTAYLQLMPTYRRSKWWAPPSITIATNVSDRGWSTCTGIQRGGKVIEWTEFHNAAQMQFTLQSSSSNSTLQLIV